jgi:hypothetical protein
MDLAKYFLEILKNFKDEYFVTDFLFIFSFALIVIIGFFAFLESIASGLSGSNSKYIPQKTIALLLYASVFILSGIFWVNFFWQNATGIVLVFNFPMPDFGCILFACR